MGREPFNAGIVPSSTEWTEDLVEERFPTFKHTAALRRRKRVREEIAEAIDNAAPDIDTGPIVEAVMNLAREKGWK